MHVYGSIFPEILVRRFSKVHQYAGDRFGDNEITDTCMVFLILSVDNEDSLTSVKIESHMAYVMITIVIIHLACHKQQSLTCGWGL